MIKAVIFDIDQGFMKDLSQIRGFPRFARQALREKR
jgi:hypothetical protein